MTWTYEKNWDRRGCKGFLHGTKPMWIIEQIGICVLCFSVDNLRI